MLDRYPPFDINGVRSTVEDIIEGVEKCLQHGFTPVVDFIFGLPGETEDEQLETLRLIQ